MADEIDIASENIQAALDARLADHRWSMDHAVRIDIPARVCAGCDSRPSGKDCADYGSCFDDFQRRISADKRNGRG